MRLLRRDADGKLSFTKKLFENTDEIPPYAILSHTWGDAEDELTYGDILTGQGEIKQGYAKVQFCEQQAERDGLHHFWVDTCCIDKTNAVELSRAINSMFSWYKKATKCYAYLSDVSARKRNHQGNTLPILESGLSSSRWFTRGWTLQELIAPASVEFFSRDGQSLGNKHTLEELIYQITDVPIAALRGTPLSSFDPNQRMQWVARRITKMPEDKVYCLLGIMDVHLPPIYGEGERNAHDRLGDALASRFRRQFNVREPSPPSSNRGQHSVGSGITHPKTGGVPLKSCHSAMKSLYFDQMDSRRAQIKPATCSWLLQHRYVKNWNRNTGDDEHGQLLWISGKPGAGKSTLVKFAHTNALAPKNRVEGQIVISFYFNARGTELEKSTLGLYRSLLHQLLEKVSDLMCILDDLEDQSECPTWTLELLCELFTMAVSKLEGRRLKLFIDALDECDEQEIRDMVSFFTELRESAEQNHGELSICFASRHYPSIVIPYGRRLVLEDEEGHEEELRKYVNKNLKAGEGATVETVRATIQEKANGVFLWAVLVVDILNKEYSRGRIFAVQERLKETPKGLSELFKDILKRDRVNMDDFQLCLQWILFAKRPLSREEFYLAMVAGLDPAPEKLRITEENTAEIRQRFVHSSSKGLAELTKTKPHTVQFIHESVRDFLIKDGGLCELWPELEGKQDSCAHDRLKRCCQNYLAIDFLSSVDFGRNLVTPRSLGRATARSADLGETYHKASSEDAKMLRTRATAAFPLLEYAEKHVLYHADEAAKGIPQTAFLEQFSFTNWLNIHNLLQQYDIRRYTANASLAYIFADNNLPRLLKTIALNGAEMHVKGERYRYPLFAAVIGGHKDSARAILRGKENTCVDDVLTVVEPGSAFEVYAAHDHLRWAIMNKHQSLAEFLLASPGLKIDPSLRDSSGKAPLWYAARDGQTIIAQHLIDHGADIASKQEALLEAASRGHDATVKLLLDTGTDVNTSDEYGTALVKAAEASKDTSAVIRLLVSRGADIDARSRSINGRTALFEAVRRKLLVDFAQLLVDRGADINARDNDGRTALFEAVGNHYISDYTQLLVDRGADINARDNDGRTALFEAVGNNDTTAHTQLLVDRGADINARDNDGRTALFKAVGNYWTSNAQLLVDRGADINARDNDGRTALFGVFRKYSVDIAQLLIDRGADINARDKYGRTALFEAVGKYYISDHTQLLVDRGADINARDNDGRTALFDTVQDVWPDRIAQALIDRGVDIHATDKNGHTVLSQSSRDLLESFLSIPD